MPAPLKSLRSTRSRKRVSTTAKGGRIAQESTGAGAFLPPGRRYSAVLWRHEDFPAKEMPTAEGNYYTGPMLRKSGLWVTADGTIVPPPAGWKPPPKENAGQQPMSPGVR